LPFLHTPIRAGKYLIIVSIRSGFLWIIDGETGKVKKTINPMRCDANDLKSDGKIDRAIIAIQPDKWGNVLIATENEYFFKNASSFYDFLKNDKQKDETPQDEKDRFSALFKSRKDFNEIRWIMVDPENGTFWQEMPLDLPTKLLDPNLFFNFNFKFDLEGKPLPA
jgi:hypothetical protein